MVVSYAAEADVQKLTRMGDIQRLTGSPKLVWQTAGFVAIFMSASCAEWI
jgi:hypothetical protein